MTDAALMIIFGLALPAVADSSDLPPLGEVSPEATKGVCTDIATWSPHRPLRGHFPQRGEDLGVARH